MEPGKFNKRMTFKNPPSALTPQNDYGEPSGSASTVATRWVFLEPVSATEQFVGDKVQGLVTHRITMRYLAGLTPASFGEIGSRTFEFLGVRNIEERNWELEILAREKV